MAAIEDAATSLVLEHGYDDVTVDQICAVAEISKRTFFNYVASKESAVTGSIPEDVADVDRVEFLDRADPDVPRALLSLFLATFAAARAGDDTQTTILLQRRREIFVQHPDLAVTRMTASSRFQLRLVHLITELFELHPSLRRLPRVPAEAEARACVALVAASGNLGLSTWLTREAATLDSLNDECLTALDQLARLVTAPTGTLQ